MKNNFLVRVVTGLVFIIIVWSAILYGVISFAILFAIISFLAIWEFSTLLNNYTNSSINKLITSISGIYLFFAFFGFCTEMTSSAVFIPYILSLLYLLISELYLEAENPLNNWAYAFASQLYIALPFALLNVLAFQAIPGTSEGEIAYSYIYPLAIFLFIWGNDSGAYAFGSMLHRFIPYKLFPRISPKKSWIGSIGGGIVVLIIAIIIHQFFPQLSLITWIGFGLIIVLFGTWGDLVESLLKRQLGIKDSGKILPGHGGILDRFDSTLLAIPAVVLYLYTIKAFF